MSNYYTRNVPIQKIHVNYLSDNIRIILNDIFFMRNIAITKPQYQYRPMYNIYQVCCEDVYLPRMIEKVINKFRLSIMSKSNMAGELVLGFYKPVEETSLFGFYKKVNKSYYEKWIIPYQLLLDVDTQDNTKDIEQLTQIRLNMQNYALHGIERMTFKSINIYPESHYEFKVPDCLTKDIVYVKHDNANTCACWFDITLSFDRNKQPTDNIQSILSSLPLQKILQ